MGERGAGAFEKKTVRVGENSGRGQAAFPIKIVPGMTPDRQGSNASNAHFTLAARALSQERALGSVKYFSHKLIPNLKRKELVCRPTP